jgi:hypothetical protein
MASTKTFDDTCEVQQRTTENNKKLKFVTTNHIDLLEGKESLNFFGLAVKDKLFVPAEKMDEDSKLRLGGTGGMLTQCNVRTGFGQLPFPTIPSKYQVSRGDVQTENSLRNYVQMNRNSTNPKDNNFHNRSFYIFDGIEQPDATKSIQPTTFGPRGGSSTRFDT